MTLSCAKILFRRCSLLPVEKKASKEDEKGHPPSNLVKEKVFKNFLLHNFFTFLVNIWKFCH